MIAMQLETLDEYVKVRADFQGGNVAPLAFKRGERVYRIDRVNANWKEREGDLTRICFSVQAEGATYFLSFSLPDALWKLGKVILDG